MATPTAPTADLAAALAGRLAGGVIASGHAECETAAYDPDNRFRLNQNIQPQRGTP